MNIERHEISFQVDLPTGRWRYVCSCGDCCTWTDRLGAQLRASVHDLDRDATILPFSSTARQQGEKQ